jgi:hypothetical protein
MKDITEEPITIFLALFPGWKMLILERIYDKIGWRSPTPEELLKIGNEVEMFKGI